MKFKLLRCLVFSFACVIGMCGVSARAADEELCPLDYLGYATYGPSCQRTCPDFISETFTVNNLLKKYSFLQLSKTGAIDVTSCAVKLDADKSHCAAGTNVVYRFNPQLGRYWLDSENFNVVPDDGYYVLYTSGPSDMGENVFELCGNCDFSKGLYNDNRVCKSCPLAGTNAEGKVDINRNEASIPYQFVQGDDDTKCYIQKKNPGSCEELVFVYDERSKKYALMEGSGMPKAHNVGYFWLDPTDLSSERCGGVQHGVPGYYITQDDEGRLFYTECPLAGTNAADMVGDGKDYEFVFSYSVCRIVLKENTSVSFVYDGTNYVQDCSAGRYKIEGSGDEDWSGNNCAECPLVGTNAEGKVGSVDTQPYKFVQGENKTKCYIQKKDPGACQDVIFVYDNTTRNYVLKEGSGIPDPATSDVYKIGGIGPADLDKERCRVITEPNQAGFYIVQDNDGYLVFNACPLDGTNAEGKVGSGDSQPYQFVQGDDDTKCYIKHKKSGAIFVYNGTSYVFSTCPSGYYEMGGVAQDNLDDDLDPHCVKTCDGGNGYYQDIGNNNQIQKTCYKCPTNENIGNDKRFVFFTPETEQGIETRQGITSCAVTLNTGAATYACGYGTKVVYTYTTGNTPGYVRTNDSVVNPKVDSIIVQDIGVNDMSTDFCKACATGEFNVKGVCARCDSPGYYKDNNGMCKICPAGYYCDGTGNKEMCPKNTYSEGGRGQCASCDVGYSTKSALQEKNTNYCETEDKNKIFKIGCTSASACKLTLSDLSVTRKDNQSNQYVVEKFILGNNVKIEAINKLVLTTKQ